MFSVSILLILGSESASAFIDPIAKCGQANAACFATRGCVRGWKDTMKHYPMTKEQREFLNQLAEILRPWWEPLGTIEHLVTALTPGGIDAFTKE